MPDVVFFQIVVIDHHDVAHHGFPMVDAEGRALTVVHIGLGETADGMGDKCLLPRGQRQMKRVQKIGFINSSEYYLVHSIPPENVFG